MKTSNPYFETELVQAHLSAAGDYVRADYLAMTEAFAGNTPFDSPLEMVFWVWWTAFVQTYAHNYIDRLFDLSSQREVTLKNGERYRVDFLISPEWSRYAERPDRMELFDKWTPIAIELDGHAFHERTREQVALRDRRDRALQSEGWKVFHFSFAEFTGNPIRCLEEIVTFARHQLFKL